MNAHQFRTKIAYAIIKLTCKYVSDTPIRNAHVQTKRDVGEKISFLLRQTETGNTFKVRQSHIHDLRKAHIRSQALLKALYMEKGPEVDDK